ncbi:hypothetical protein ES332_D08G241900v1 [Gossypium tomentosum]|uniref:Zinc finger PHD-type domain-containing protein n=1 Tax=Gossypium tomentosum TaxID=34277 RepID=A0A5D2JY10_GOSTO|nr:hypothetical protein ES332_D08G241900v1 [Gossypium tomentosum]
MEIQHFGYHHPLVFIQARTVASKTALCLVCEKPVVGCSYGCNQCQFYLHKGCAKLELAPKIQHSFHPKHPLTLLSKSPYFGFGICNFYRKKFGGFIYNCNDCSFDLHINCALLQSSIAANFPNSLHPHLLLFIQNHNNEVKSHCSGCQKPMSGPIYHCSDCTYPYFNLHKECAELPLEINYPYDRRHPLTLLPQPPTYPQKCSCYLCRIQWKGFVYSCSLCNFDLSLDDFLFSSPTITIASHEHPWMLVSRKMSFVCDFCGTDGDHTPYFCATCHLLVHKNCISLPRHIMITRHRHTISLSHSLRQNQVKDWMCKICYEEVDIRYGNYRCPTSRCHYIAHVCCTTNKAIWDGTIMPEGYDERSEEMVDEPWNLITDVVEQIRIGKLMVASEIKHSYHDHNLRLTFSGKTKDDDSQCDGCEQCKFFIQKDCAELPKEMPHPFHKHLFTLSNSHNEYGCQCCDACGRVHQGFKYRCYKRNCGFSFDIQCMLLSDTLKHPSHEHSLFLVHNNEGTSCSACFRNLQSRDVAYRCMKRCDFSLDVGCASLPLTGWYKFDRHALTLTFSDDSEPSQFYCDLCEKEREPNRWFYYCADCDNSLHLNCAIGDLPYLKLGNKLEQYGGHKHPFTVVKNIWNCPPCKVCGEVCNGQALECKVSECNFTVHWNCGLSLFEAFE